MDVDNEAAVSVAALYLFLNLCRKAVGELESFPLKLFLELVIFGFTLKDDDLLSSTISAGAALSLGLFIDLTPPVL